MYGLPDAIADVDPHVRSITTSITLPSVRYRAAIVPFPSVRFVNVGV